MKYAYGATAVEVGLKLGDIVQFGEGHDNFHHEAHGKKAEFVHDDESRNPYFMIQGGSRDRIPVTLVSREGDLNFTWVSRANSPITRKEVTPDVAQQYAEAYAAFESSKSSMELQKAYLNDLAREYALEAVE